MNNIANIVLERLLEHYDIKTKKFLQNYSTPFQLLVAALLSAQSTDKQVNNVTKKLFEKFPDPKSFASSAPKEIEQYIKSVGLYKNKAKNIYDLSNVLVNEYNSAIPKTISDLIKLPGIGRKTANVVLNDWFKINEGIAVDTHVQRISYRIGLTKNTNPRKIEHDLMLLFPKDSWDIITRLFISHGREICLARNPKCNICFLNDICQKNIIKKTLSKKRN
ncbi:MAG: endonuclease III [Candidatus Heimdallarchaeum endolithica]|uniref:Endonuclease III n=1 Tax=Candidatus Heimdallarchaeum endolithica TaxID=2876572 RepID=A0A9Y1BQ99_9ARCH|nr:MAG: endonuclease III [Candidatus Heimdallarchaeum endolithica]